MDEGIAYVVERYNELFDLLGDWGYEVVPDPDFDSWQQIVRDGTLTGHVKLVGTRDNGDGTHMTVKLEEFWVKGDRAGEAAFVREDGSLWGYCYHCQAPGGAMRWCLDPVGHANNPCHVHPFAYPEGGEAEACDPLTVWEALETFEQHAYLDEFGHSEEE